MTIDEVLKEAAARGVKDLPEPSRLTHVRVWPAHADKWVAEVGEPPHNVTVGELHATKADARAAGLAHLEEARAVFQGVLPEDLVGQVMPWPQAVVSEWD
ncbi:hypothetical protein [Streptomyces luteireticuli]|uniref:Uncharacterized protein n=1 Tax=Streptomyces luteireticuli TaxID=173858 RepID=A0ABN0Y604_9ACTN